MKNESKSILLQEQIRKIKYKTNYIIGESPRYRSLIDGTEEFDNVPTEIYNTNDGQPVPQSPAFTNEAGEQEDAPKPEGQTPPEASNSQPIDNSKPLSDVNANDDSEENPEDADSMGGTANPAGDKMDVNAIQNDIIKHNIAAMQSINDELKSLDATVNALNSKMDILSADVEEVREPTNGEKLMNKTKTSYPYYFNLNDLWSENSFEGRRKQEKENGLRKLPDGTFIAEFDDLPQSSKQDVQASFSSF